MIKTDLVFNFENPDDSPGYLLAQLTLLWQRKQKKVLDPLDLTSTQFALMAAVGWLAKQSENVTQIDIAMQTNFDRMMVSKVLRTLEAKKIVSRQPHKTDTRAKTIELTKDGSTILQKAIVAVEQADKDFFSFIDDGLFSFNAKMAILIKENKG